MKKILKEACIDDYSSADYYINLSNEIDRFETCSKLEKGGLTPSVKLFEYIKKNSDIEQVVMIRNKDTFYIENSNDISTLKKHIIKFINKGAKHFIFGYLTKDNKIDVKNCQELINIIKNIPDTSWSFHMAIDEVDNYDEAFETLIKLKFKRVLTKGGKNSAMDNIDNLRRLFEKFSNNIEILVGGKVTKDNLLSIYEKTKINQFHGRKIA